ncbi:unnamed protein product [Vitrella brassicaformis CCMP3155]|uniref:Uncharacterized protein n=2 Tax=Vitrella brassicaformis TaxID=1169539 RepID=A0A0G4G031_VITBC|nr:unnamed protein product [Vitrella brassicaformis CCMP3155]|eukprot:CEM21176.1 unnamed protein product [Vitrella brassicaformis CCMP3155]
MEGRWRLLAGTAAQLRSGEVDGIETLSTQEGEGCAEAVKVFLPFVFTASSLILWEDTSKHDRDEALAHQRGGIQQLLLQKCDAKLVSLLRGLAALDLRSTLERFRNELEGDNVIIRDNDHDVDMRTQMCASDLLEELFELFYHAQATHRAPPSPRTPASPPPSPQLPPPAISKWRDRRLVQTIVGYLLLPDSSGSAALLELVGYSAVVRCLLEIDYEQSRGAGSGGERLWEGYCVVGVLANCVGAIEELQVWVVDELCKLLTTHDETAFTAFAQSVVVAVSRLYPEGTERTRRRCEAHMHAQPRVCALMVGLYDSCEGLLAAMANEPPVIKLEDLGRYCDFRSSITSLRTMPGSSVVRLRLGILLYLCCCSGEIPSLAQTSLLRPPSSPTPTKAPDASAVVEMFDKGMVESSRAMGVLVVVAEACGMEAFKRCGGVTAESLGSGSGGQAGLLLALLSLFHHHGCTSDVVDVCARVLGEGLLPMVDDHHGRAAAVEMVKRGVRRGVTATTEGVEAFPTLPASLGSLPLPPAPTKTLLTMLCNYFLQTADGDQHQHADAHTPVIYAKLMGLFSSLPRASSSGPPRFVPVWCTWGVVGVERMCRTAELYEGELPAPLEVPCVLDVLRSHVWGGGGGGDTRAVCHVALMAASMHATNRYSGSGVSLIHLLHSVPWMSALRAAAHDPFLLECVFAPLMKALREVCPELFCTPINPRVHHDRKDTSSCARAMDATVHEAVKAMLADVDKTGPLPPPSPDAAAQRALGAWRDVFSAEALLCVRRTSMTLMTLVYQPDGPAEQLPETIHDDPNTSHYPAAVENPSRLVAELPRPYLCRLLTTNVLPCVLQALTGTLLSSPSTTPPVSPAPLPTHDAAAHAQQAAYAQAVGVIQHMIGVCREAGNTRELEDCVGGFVRASSVRLPDLPWALLERGAIPTAWLGPFCRCVPEVLPLLPFLLEHINKAMQNAAARATQAGGGVGTNDMAVYFARVVLEVCRHYPIKEQLGEAPTSSPLQAALSLVTMFQILVKHAHEIEGFCLLFLQLIDAITPSLLSVARTIRPFNQQLRAFATEAEASLNECIDMQLAQQQQQQRAPKVFGGGQMGGPQRLSAAHTQRLAALRDRIRSWPGMLPPAETATATE